MKAGDRRAVEARFRSEWPQAVPERLEKIVEFLLRIFDRYVADHLADPHFISELLSPTPGGFRQRISELLMAEWLWRNGFALTCPANGHGPDFLLRKGRHRAWLELTSPEPSGIDPVHLTPPQLGESRVLSEPFDQRLLRWTQALQAKQLQLQAHIEAGIVLPGDAYVIAVNGFMLNPVWSDIMGVSGRPVPIELGFGAGPLAVSWTPDAGFDAQLHTTYRGCIRKLNNAPVSSHLFKWPAFDHVSAILGVSLDNNGAFGRPYSSAVVYNPRAIRRIPTCWLPAGEHWTGKDCVSHWRLRRHHAPRRRCHR